MKCVFESRLRTFIGLSFVVPSCVTMAQQQDILGPSGSEAFGTAVTMLANGNFVVTDPGFSTVAALAVGAVYLYSPKGVLISKLTGSAANDRVGNGGVVVLHNGNYVISSNNWSNNGVADAGAATWGSATAGVDGVVSPSNSLVGTHTGDQVSGYGVTALVNGNYVVSSWYWNGELGAATWGNGTTGTAGIVSATNSLIGSAVGDHVSFGGGIVPLDNGSYVVASSNWKLSVGAATWCDGDGPTSAEILPSNSLVGSQDADFVGVGGVNALPGGNYVVLSPFWKNGDSVQAGAATWSDKSGGTVGAITSANSLVGTHSVDHVGSRVVVLSNGNYIVNSPNWFDNRGAVTWALGGVGLSGEVSELNSFVASGNVQPLSDGNFVVWAPYWTNGDVYAGGTASVGAVAWGDGGQPFLGTISTNNSLIGTHDNDEVAYGGVAALSGGRYAIASPYWSGGIGAITIAGGTWPTSGTVSASNSITGYAGNSIGGAGYLVTSLSDGNYVFTTDYSSNGLASWQSADGATDGWLSPDNSIRGTWSGATVKPLAKGNWILFSPHWTNDQTSNRGAVTLVHGGHPVSDTVRAGNSVLGGVANAGAQMVFDYDPTTDHLVVGRPAENIVTIFDGNLVFKDGFE